MVRPKLFTQILNRRSRVTPSTSIGVEVELDDSASVISQNTFLSVSNDPVEDIDIDQLSILISEARTKGNLVPWKRVKAFFKRAKRVPKNERTETQKHVLKHYRGRGWSSSTLSLPLSPSTSGSPPEIFVDASPYGIGLVFNDRWLAWTFTPHHKSLPIGSNGVIIIRWAELVAVELGVIALISAGHRQTRVVVWSDNEDVVVAVTERAWTANDGFELVLARILRVCEDAGVELIAKWLSGKENPADGPSRGQYMPHGKMLDWKPEVPEDLMDMVNLVSRY